MHPDGNVETMVRQVIRNVLLYQPQPIVSIQDDAPRAARVPKRVVNALEDLGEDELEELRRRLG